MGPTNQALVELFLADQLLREAQGRLADVTRNVRLQERKVTDLTGRETTSKTELNKLQVRAGELDLEIKSRDARIEQLRTQQQQAQTNKEYQAFLVQINTQKVDKAKFEEEALNLLERIEALSGEHKTLLDQGAVESEKHTKMKGEIDTKVRELSKEIEALKPARITAAASVPEKALVVFERLAERYDGEALESIDKPHPKREEYIATVCNIDLTLDVYNKLHSRDEIVFCSGCGCILYIPDHLTPEKAVHKPKEKKPAREKKAPGEKKIGEKKPRVKKSDLAAPVSLQTLASSVVHSVDRDESLPIAETLTDEPASTLDVQVAVDESDIKTTNESPEPAAV